MTVSTTQNKEQTESLISQGDRTTYFTDTSYNKTPKCL